MSSHETQDILFESLNGAGIITLNRPRSLNAMNEPIISHLLPKLQEWEKQKKIVIIKGAGKAFCAGGDIKDVVKAKHGSPFLLVEYNIDHLTGNYKIPYVALIDGITMGGGLGISVHGRYRVATENTAVAMPEAKIGLMPDVGGSYFLPRLPYYIGYYLGLTSKAIFGKDVAAVGIATHFVSSHRLKELESALTHCVSHAEVKETLDKFHEPVGEQFSFSKHLKDIVHCFSAPTVEEIIKRLKLVDNKWSADTIQAMQRMSPLSLKITLKALQKGIDLSLWQCLQMEYRICGRLVYAYNFKEGVRALLIDKDDKPKWNPATLEEIDESTVESYFGPLPIGELTLLSLNSKL